MKHFIYCMISVFSLMFTSCVGYTYAQDVSSVEAVVIPDGIDVNVIIQNGTPYYYDGVLSYYLYNGIYYYPYYYRNYWYLRPMSRPYHYGYHPRFRYRHGDIGFRNHRYGYTRPRITHHGSHGDTYHHRNHNGNFERHRNPHNNGGISRPHTFGNRHGGSGHMPSNQHRGGHNGNHRR